jgi:hypothetical protein
MADLSKIRLDVGVFALVAVGAARLDALGLHMLAVKHQHMGVLVV